MAGTRIDTPSTDASVDADTDVEGFIISEDWSVKEYTLGKAFFQFTLLADLVSSSDADETWPEFDVRGTPFRSCKFADPQQSRLSELRGNFRTRQSFRLFNEGFRETYCETVPMTMRSSCQY